ncbi:MAG TPA: 4-hydroxythreonine-4-phosphate dehydrogenase PdxA, partial [Casimicrobiaceae bacterium]|nr:4-hydroxythreonine-4-phosphate dehydrogenase PdxA [Casimicrobiaceae bacterium]
MIARTAQRPVIAVTSGEPAGIGPELCAMLAARHAADPFAASLILIGDRELLQQRAARIGVDVQYAPYDAAKRSDSVSVFDVPLIVAAVPGKPDAANAQSVLTMLRTAADNCATGAFDAMTTAPVQKSVIEDAGFPFTGHTEFLAQRSGTPRVVMMLVGGESGASLRVALATTHVPLSEVAQAIDAQSLVKTFAIVDTALREQFGIARPRIAVCGLNPHAGEGGHLGREEIETIAPAIAESTRAGVDIHGPYPADTIFVPRHAREFDAIVAMFHDQGLPVLKAASFGGGVNVTLGLPFIRTSVDHGTALDL